MNIDKTLEAKDYMLSPVATARVEATVVKLAHYIARAREMELLEVYYKALRDVAIDREQLPIIPPCQM